MKNIAFLFSIIFLTTSCAQDCYEVIKVKEIEYDVSNLKNGETAKPENIISEKINDPENDYFTHFFNDEFSYSASYYGEEVIERKTNRRFVKRRSDHYEEKMRYEDNPTVVTATLTGNKRQIGRHQCDEYIFKRENAFSQSVYINTDYPFTYEYLHPSPYPGFVVARQLGGDDKTFETQYEIRKVKCNEKFINAINEVKKLLD